MIDALVAMWTDERVCVFVYGLLTGLAVAAVRELGECRRKQAIVNEAIALDRRLRR